MENMKTKDKKKASGDVLTPATLEQAKKSARLEMHKPTPYPEWYVKMMGYGKHRKHDKNKR